MQETLLEKVGQLTYFTIEMAGDLLHSGSHDNTTDALDIGAMTSMVA